jgi:hypothetical protein
LSATPLLTSPILYFWEMSGFEPRELVRYLPPPISLIVEKVAPELFCIKMLKLDTIMSVGFVQERDA